MNFGEFATIPTIGNNPVLRGQGTREVITLCGAGDGWKSGIDSAQYALIAKRVQSRRVRAEQGFRKADNIDDRGALHAPTSCGALIVRK
jgi:hypothetical protein